MNKNGFIATSLIYSFFLIFITLFLTIIADYLQDKVLLNTIEKGIKDELNSTMSIEDFEVGDILSFEIDYSDNGAEEIKANDTWIVASVNYNNDDKNLSELILYSYETGKSSNCLSEQNIIDDLNLVGSLNSTYLNKLLYTFDDDYFTLDSKKIEKNSSCVVISDNTIDITTCDSGSTNDCRERKKLRIGMTKFQYENAIDNNSITIKGVVS